MKPYLTTIMKPYLSALGSMLFGVTLCIAQTTEKAKVNAVSFEVGKTGLIYNLNFDHKLSPVNYGFRFGLGSNFGRYLNVITISGGGYHLIGKEQKFFELGLDVQYLIADEISDDQKEFASIFVYPNYAVRTIYPSLNIGYRVYGKKTLFRVGLSPGMIESKLVPGGYISCGLTF